MYGEMIRRSPAVFSEIAATYDEVRPAYPLGLYECVDEVSRIGSESRVLEVGAGSGVATEQILAAWNPYLTVLEPGPELYRLLRERFHLRGKVEIEPVKFEDFKPKRKYDFLFFRKRPSIGLIESGRFVLADAALKARGFLVLYWNNYSRNDDPLFDEIQTGL